MKKTLSLILTVLTLFFIPKFDYGQAPNLGTAGNFAVFTSAGAITNTGTTVINGNLGAFVGAYTGVPLPTVNGQVHLTDAVAQQAAADVCAAYDLLGAPACSPGDIVIGTTLGNGQTLTPGTYCTGAATTINGNLTFDAQGNPNAIFIVQVDGTLGTSANSTISLINGANQCNVFFQVSGAVSLGPNSAFLGTVLGRGAISLATGATVQGRLLACVGAINLFNNIVTNPCNAPPCPAILVSAVSGTINCAGGTAALTVTATGGTGPYTYSINGGVSFQLSNVFNVSAGAHVVIAKDANGCTGATVTVNVTAPLPITLVSATAGVCVNGVGSITVAATGGTGTLQYSLNGGVFQSSPVFSGLANGSYTVTIRDANNCTFAAATAVLVNCVPACPTITVGAVAGTINCAGGITTLTATATGGTGPYTYSINGGVSFQASNIFNVNAGVYIVIAKDANGCTGATVTVNVTAPLPITLVSATAGVCVSGLGNITVVATGGTGALQFSLNGGVFQASPVFSGLANGSYTVTIRDANNCTFAAATAVLVNCVATCPTITVSALVGTINCAGGTTTLTATATGGAGPYTYSINGGVSFQASNVFNVSAGAYVVIAKDANGCIGGTATVNITAPLPITLVSATAGACINNLGSITVVATGGTGTLQYSLNGGVFQASPVFAGLANGSYIVTVRDANNCTFAAATAVLVNCVAACPAITVSALVGTINCAGGTTTLTVTATGGTGPYTYSINGGVSFQASNVFTISAGTYVVIAKGANGCTGTTAAVCVTAPPPITLVCATTVICTANTGTITVMAGGGTGTLQYSINNGPYQASPVFTGLANGSYIIRIRDINNCIFASAAILVSCGGPCPAITVGVAAGSIACAGGTTNVTATVSGGTGPYTYSINGGVSFQASNVFTVGAFSYSIIAKDANGCTGASTKINVVAPLPITLVSATAGVCTGSLGSITIVANGGTGTLQYSINNGPYQASPVFTGLANGSYTVKIRDANNCIFAAATAVVVNCGGGVGVCPPITVNALVGNIACYGGTTIFTVTATGGTAPYTYSINGGISFQASNVFTVGAFSYSIIAKDANGCTGVSANINVIAPAPITLVSATGTCAGSVGTITVVATGGTGALQYSLNYGPFQSNPVFTGLANGNYTVIIRDANNCIFTAAASVFVNCNGTCPAITVGVVPGTINCAGGTATLTATGSGGTGPYTYSINGGISFQASNVFTVGAGANVILAKDSRGCTGASATITVTAPLPIVLVSATAGVCTGNLGSITVIANGGTGTLQYSLNGGVYQTGNVFTGLANGNYLISIRDANNCILVSTTAVFVNCVVNCPLTLRATAVCLNGTATITATLADALTRTTQSTTANAVAVAATYTISGNGIVNVTGATTGIFLNVPNGTYTITAIVGGCTYTVVVVVNCGNCPAINVTALCGIIQCYGGSTAITVNVSGGQAPYMYSINGSTNFQTSNIFTVGSGSYTFTVRDANGCIGVSSVLVTTQSQPIVATVSAGTCLNGRSTITVQASGGTGALQYSINNGQSYQSSNVFANVASGTYSILVRDAYYCTIQCTTLVLVNCVACPDTPPTCPLTLSATPVYLGGIATVTATLSGSPAGAVYVISGNGIVNVTGATSGIFTMVPNGTYTITVTLGGCTYTTVVIVNCPPAISVLATPNPFSNHTRFQIHSDVAGYATLDLYNMSGILVDNVYKGNITAGATINVDYAVPAGLSKNLMTILRIGNKQATQKLVNIQ